VLQVRLAIGSIGCNIADENKLFIDKGHCYMVVALADRYIAGPLPLKRVENLELLGRQDS